MTTPHQPTRTARVPFWVLTLLPLMLVTLLTIWACDAEFDDDDDPNSCGVTAHCDPGLVCKLNSCIEPECESDDQCPEQLTCGEGLCYYAGDDGCGGDPPCEEGNTCIDGYCWVDECLTNKDCEADHVCQDGTCVDAP